MDNLQKLEAAFDPCGQIIDKRCSHCVRYQVIIEKYKGLINLLNRKIHQLERRAHTQIITDSCIIREGQATARTSRSVGKTLKRQFSISQQIRVAMPSLQETVKPSLIANFAQSKQKWGFSSQSIWKQASLINNLTSQIIQLKSNFMHIRQCIYSLFQEVNLWRHISKNGIGVNMGLVLFNIFEYSQQEKEQMCRLRKVKLRKHQTSSKENVFVTVKQI